MLELPTKHIEQDIEVVEEREPFSPPKFTARYRGFGSAQACAAKEDAKNALALIVLADEARKDNEWEHPLTRCLAVLAEGFQLPEAGAEFKIDYTLSVQQADGSGLVLEQHNGLRCIAGAGYLASHFERLVGTLHAKADSSSEYRMPCDYDGVSGGVENPCVERPC